jgi:hypothetical protein
MTANVNVTKVLFRRGNTAQNAAYTGINGEVTVDTQAFTLRIHDGTTAGGTVINAGGVVGSYSNTNTAAYLDSQNITSANIGGSQTFANANAAVQATSINNINANLGAFQTYANATFGTSSYANANVQSYLAAFDGNILPSANVTYSLGDATHQWRDLWVSNNTIYIGNTPIRVDGGTLLVNNAPVTGGSTYGNANVATYLTRGNVTVGNITIQDEYDQQWRFSNGALIWPAGDGTPTGPYIEGSSLMTVYPENDGEFRIQTYSTTAGGSRQWKFTSDGNLIVPDDATIWSDVDLRLYSETGNIALGNQNGFWHFDNNDVLTFPTGANTNGSSYNGGSANVAVSLNSINSNGDTVSIRAEGANSRGVIETYSNAGNNTWRWIFDETGTLTVPSSPTSIQGDLNHDVTIGTNNGNVVYTFTFTQSGSLNVPVDIQASGNVVTPIVAGNGLGNLTVMASTQSWLFDIDGVLTLPSNSQIVPAGNTGVRLSAGVGDLTGMLLNNTGDAEIYAFGNVSFYADSDNTSIGWTFDSTGNMRLPANGNILYANGVSILDGISGTYGNTEVASYLETYTGNVTANDITATGIITGNIFAPGTSTQVVFNNNNLADADAGFTYDPANETVSVGNTVVASNLTVTANASVGNISATQFNFANGVNILSTVGSTYGNTQVAEYLANYDGTINFTASPATISVGEITAANVSSTNGFFWGNGVAYSTSSGSTYSDANVEAYIGGNIGAFQIFSNANSAAQATSIDTINANLGSFQTYANATFGVGSYGNTQVAAYLLTYPSANVATLNTTSANITTVRAANFNSANAVITGGYISALTNVTVITGNAGSLYAATVNATNANVTTAVATNFSTANAVITGGYATGLANLTVTGNISVGNLIGTDPNTVIITGAYSSTFDNTGNVTLTGNIKVNNQAFITYTPSTTSGAAIVATGKDTQGGTGYFDFLRVTNTTSGATSPNKTLRLTSTGGLEIVNSAYSSLILTISDAGNLEVTGSLTSSGKMGYSTGSTVTQTTNRGNGVTINSLSGTIVTTSAVLAAGGVDAFFVLNNKVDPSTDIVAVQVTSYHNGVYLVTALPYSVGSPGFYIFLRNLDIFSTASEAVTIRFMVLKSPNA